MSESVCVCLRVCVSESVCVSKCMHACVHTYWPVCAYVYMCAWMCIRLSISVCMRLREGGGVCGKEMSREFADISFSEIFLIL